MVRETTPACSSSPSARKLPASACTASHDRRHHAFAEPFEGSFYKEALHMSRVAREMFCLMEGATCILHPLPSGVARFHRSSSSPTTYAA